MKKWIVLLAVTIMAALALTGCGCMGCGGSDYADDGVVDGSGGGTDGVMGGSADDTADDVVDDFVDDADDMIDDAGNAMDDITGGGETGGTDVQSGGR